MPRYLSALRILEAIEKQLRKSPVLVEVIRNPNWRWHELRTAVQNETVERNTLRRAAQLSLDGDSRFDPGAD